MHYTWLNLLLQMITRKKYKYRYVYREKSDGNILKIKSML